MWTKRGSITLEDFIGEVNCTPRNARMLSDQDVHLALGRLVNAPGQRSVVEAEIRRRETVLAKWAVWISIAALIVSATDPIAKAFD